MVRITPTSCQIWRVSFSSLLLPVIKRYERLRQHMCTAIFFASSMRFLAVVYWTHSDREDRLHGYALDAAQALLCSRSNFVVEYS